MVLSWERVWFAREGWALSPVATTLPSRGRSTSRPFALSLSTCSLLPLTMALAHLRLLSPSRSFLPSIPFLDAFIFAFLFL